VDPKPEDWPFSSKEAKIRPNAWKMLADNFWKPTRSFWTIPTPTMTVVR